MYTACDKKEERDKEEATRWMVKKKKSQILPSLHLLLTEHLKTL